MHMPPEVQSLLSMGVGGAVLVFVVRPLMSFLFQEMRSQREGFIAFLNNHAQHEEQLMTEIRDVLHELKRSMKEQQ